MDNATNSVDWTEYLKSTDSRWRYWSNNHSSFTWTAGSYSHSFRRNHHMILCLSYFRRRRPICRPSSMVLSEPSLSACQYRQWRDTNVLLLHEIGEKHKTAVEPQAQEALVQTQPQSLSAVPVYTETSLWRPEDDYRQTETDVCCVKTTTGTQTERGFLDTNEASLKHFKQILACSGRTQ